MTTGGSTRAQSGRYYKLSVANPWMRGAARTNREGEYQSGQGRMDRLPPQLPIQLGWAQTPGEEGWFPGESDRQAKCSVWQ